MGPRCRAARRHGQVTLQAFKYSSLQWGRAAEQRGDSPLRKGLLRQARASMGPRCRAARRLAEAAGRGRVRLASMGPRCRAARRPANTAASTVQYCPASMGPRCRAARRRLSFELHRPEYVKAPGSSDYEDKVNKQALGADEPADKSRVFKDRERLRAFPHHRAARCPYPTPPGLARVEHTLARRTACPSRGD